VSIDSVTAGRRIRELRRAQRVSAQSIATRTGLSRESIARIEAGESNPVLDTLSRIAGALGVSAATLLEPDEGVDTSDDGATRSDNPGTPPTAPTARKRTRLSARSSVSLRSPEGALEAMWSDEGLFWPIELPASDTPQLLRIFAWGQQPDDPPSLYYGHHEDEFLVVLDGTLDVIVANRRYRLEAGDSVHLVGTQPHQFEVAGDRPVRVVSMLLPASDSAAGPASRR
jgi:transcriptional regulator with XRE-family HTH domain